MAGIRLRNRRWYIYWQDGPRKLERPIGDLPRYATEREARAHERDAIAFKRTFERVHGAGGLTLPGAVTVDEALTEFLAEKRLKKAPATAKQYEKHAKHFRRLLRVDRKLDEILPAAIRNYHAKRAKEASRVTADKELVSLGTFWSWAEGQHYARRGESPVDAVEPFGDAPTEKEPCPKPVLVSFLRALRADLVDRVHPHDRHARQLVIDVLRTLWRTGIRPGELCRIEPSDVDLKLGAFRVRATRQKGGPRWVVLPACLVRLFRRRLALKQAFVFANSGGLCAYDALYKFRTDWLKLHPEHEPAAFHRFRHALSTRAEDAGLEDGLRSRGLLGHRTVQTSERYTHRQIERLRRALATIEEFERMQRRSRPAK